MKIPYVSELRRLAWLSVERVEVPLQHYFVPVRKAGITDALVIRTGRQPRGGRVGIAFTHPDRLMAAIGEGQQWTRPSEPALRAMLLPLGINGIQVDPILVAASIAPSPVPATGPTRLVRAATTSERVDGQAAEVMSR